MFPADAFVDGGDSKAAAFYIIEYGAEEAWRIYIRIAKPIDGPAHAGERNRAHVSNDAVILDRLIHDDWTGPCAKGSEERMFKLVFGIREPEKKWTAWKTMAKNRVGLAVEVI